MDWIGLDCSCKANCEEEEGKGKGDKSGENYTVLVVAGLLLTCMDQRYESNFHAMISRVRCSLKSYLQIQQKLGSRYLREVQ